MGMQIKTEKLDAVCARFKALDEKVQDASVIADNKAWAELCRERAELEPIVEKYAEYKKAQSDYNDATEMLHADDAELAALAKEECDSLVDSLERIVDELKIMLLPKDPNDGKNAVLEIRPAAGGEEAALFATELCRMYKMYAEKRQSRIFRSTIPSSAAQRRPFSVSAARTFFPVSNTRAACTECSACP